MSNQVGKRGAKTYLLNLVLSKPRNSINYDPRQRPAKVDGFVHDEGHDTSGEDIVLHVRVPGEPHALSIVERDIVL
jgi:hypothetical protein